MKTNLISFFAAAVLVAGATLYAPESEASGNDVVCSVAFTTSVKGETFRNAACRWPSGASLWMQCDADVFFSSTSPFGNNTQPDAGSLDLVAVFSSNRDPVQILLNNNQTHVTVLGATASGTCKFAAATRRY